MNKNIIKKISTAPKAPGVYLFYKSKVKGQRSNVSLLYIGKAANLKARLKSYLKATDHKTHILNQEATRLKYIELTSPIEALIEEAKLIKKLKPQLNVYWSDDKNHFYATFTNNPFPRIFITHQPGAATSRGTGQAPIGPFTDGRALKLILKIIRRHVPYCTCKKSHLRHCLNAQLGLCPGYCCIRTIVIASDSEAISHKKIATSPPAPRDDQILKYQKNIKTIKDILLGKNKRLLKKITRPSDEWALNNILQHAPHLNPITGHRKSCNKRIECYDISNFAGKEAVGAMTVLVNKKMRTYDVHSWEPDKSQFRKFKIRSSATRDDPRMIAEILARRLNHPEWPYPDTIIIDGGLTQYNAAKKVLSNIKITKPIELVSFAKPAQTVYGATNLPKRVIQKAIQQTHNYVIRYHRSLRDKLNT